jgi:hypothetical protein
MFLYKLTKSDMTTKNGFRYEIGKRASAEGTGFALCSGDFLHAYEHPVMAVLMNVCHADFHDYRMFKCEGEGEFIRDGKMKIGIKHLTPIEELCLPMLTEEQLITIALKLVIPRECRAMSPQYREILENFLNGWLIDTNTPCHHAAGALYDTWRFDYNSFPVARLGWIIRKRAGLVMHEDIHYNAATIMNEVSKRHSDLDPFDLLDSIYTEPIIPKEVIA